MDAAVMDPKSLPAFPCPTGATLEREGMSLRDYFAVAALSVVQSGHQMIGENYIRTSSHSKVAKDAYELADAMLKARME